MPLAREKEEKNRDRAVDFAETVRRGARRRFSRFPRYRRLSPWTRVVAVALFTRLGSMRDRGEKWWIAYRGDSPEGLPRVTTPLLTGLELVPLLFRHLPGSLLLLDYDNHILLTNFVHDWIYNQLKIETCSLQRAIKTLFWIDFECRTKTNITRKILMFFCRFSGVVAKCCKCFNHRIHYSFSRETNCYTLWQLIKTFSRRKVS